MQHVQKLEPLLRQKQPVVPLRVAIVRPSIWQRVKAWREKTLTTEAAAEIILGAVTIVLGAGLFVSFARALAHYTIIPWP